MREYTTGLPSEIGLLSEETDMRFGPMQVQHPNGFPRTVFTARESVKATVFFEILAARLGVLDRQFNEIAISVGWGTSSKWALTYPSDLSERVSFRRSFEAGREDGEATRYLLLINQKIGLRYRSCTGRTDIRMFIRSHQNVEVEGRLSWDLAEEMRESGLEVTQPKPLLVDLDREIYEKALSGVSPGTWPTYSQFETISGNEVTSDSLFQRDCFVGASFPVGKARWCQSYTIVE